MHLLIIKCALCKKAFSRRKGQVNEAKKVGWNQFCSSRCMAKSKMTGTEFRCGNPKCRNEIYRSVKEIQKVTQSFCSHSCSAKINNRLRASLKPVNHCSNVYCGAPIPRYQKYCSQLHASEGRKIPEETQKRQIVAKINAFYKNHERIPAKREMYGLYKKARSAFGNWNKAIEAAGFRPNPVLFARKYIARDGHKCDSFTEKIIDDWLYERNVEHQRNVPYPQNNALTADFVIGKTWIEFFGLAGVVKKYDKLRKKKLKLASLHKIKFIGIYPKDLFPVNKLSEILKL